MRVLPLVLGLAVGGCGGKAVPVEAVGEGLATGPTPTMSPPEVTQEESMEPSWIDVPRRRVAVGDLDLAVFDTGGDGPAVLLVHGMGSTSAFWQKQLTGGRLAGYRLIAPDLPGWGDSEAPDAAYTPSFYAEVMIGLMDALDLKRPHIAAHSMGGQAALRLALDHPERIASLILSAPAGIETFTEAEAAAINAFWAGQDLAGRTEAEARASYGLAFARWDDDVERLLQDRMALAETPRIDDLVRSTRRSVAGMLAEPVHDRLGELTLPVLYIHGTADAMIPARAVHPDQTPATVAAAARTGIAGLRVEALDGAGHTPHHDAPEAFDALLGSFLDAH